MKGHLARLPVDRRALGPAPTARPARSAASAIGTAGQRVPALNKQRRSGHSSHRMWTTRVDSQTASGMRCAV